MSKFNDRKMGKKGIDAFHRTQKRELDMLLPLDRSIHIISQNQVELAILRRELTHHTHVFPCSYPHGCQDHIMDRIHDLTHEVLMYQNQTYFLTDAQKRRYHFDLQTHMKFPNRESEKRRDTDRMLRTINRYHKSSIDKDRKRNQATETIKKAINKLKAIRKERLDAEKIRLSKVRLSNVTRIV